MASMRDIKRRRSSIQSTQQITKAMKLVSTVKLQKARAGAERSKAYFECMYATVHEILSRVGHVDNRYLQKGLSSKKGVVLITSNRGLAGGYNSGAVKLVTRNEAWKKEDVVVYALGAKGRDALAREGYRIRLEETEAVEEPLYADAVRIAAVLLEDFEKGEIGEIYLGYTSFKNTVSHIPTLMRLLPVESPVREEERREKGAAYALMNFEPEDEEDLEMIVPKYVSSLIYGALMEAVASENGARMQAMDSATSNAADMIDDLTLKYNRARQSSITQELTEIIAGAEAIS